MEKPIFASEASGFFRRMSTQRFFVRLSAPTWFVRYYKVVVLYNWQIGKEFLVPRQPVNVNLHDPQIWHSGGEVRIHHSGQVTVKIMWCDIYFVGFRRRRDLH